MNSYLNRMTRIKKHNINHVESLLKMQQFMYTNQSHLDNHVAFVVSSIPIIFYMRKYKKDKRMGERCKRNIVLCAYSLITKAILSWYWKIRI